jgi:endonuclease/exonuclease/phosphatase family metal-dependent hydrolase
MLPSPSLGRTSYLERYVVVYDSTDFSYIESYTYNDVGDVFEREPFIARFSRNGIDFTLVICHVKPGDAYREIRELERVATEVVTKYNDPDVIIAGDLNSDCSYFSSPLFTNYHATIIYGMDTTVGNSYCAYDRIFVSSTLKSRIASSGVDRNPLITAEVSDHYPVYVQFLMDN